MKKIFLSILVFSFWNIGVNAQIETNPKIISENNSGLKKLQIIENICNKASKNSEIKCVNAIKEEIKTLKNSNTISNESIKNLIKNNKECFKTLRQIRIKNLTKKVNLLEEATESLKRKNHNTSSLERIIEKMKRNAQKLKNVF